MTDYNWLVNFFDWVVRDFTRLLVISGILATIIVYGPIVARKFTSRSRSNNRRSDRRS